MPAFEWPKGIIPGEGPHRAVDNVLDSVADSAKGVITSVVGGCKGAGDGLMGALDKPFTKITGKSGPHRVVDRGLNGVADSISNFTCNGMIGSLKILGESVSEALDHPIEQLK